MEKLIIYADGGARGNPGPAGAGAAVINEQGDILAESAHFLGHTTNNVAEYTALIDGLTAAIELKKAKGESVLEIRMDSELVIRQLTGRYKVKHPGLAPLFKEAKALIEKHFNHVIYTHVPREKNKIADALANQAMDRGV
jgi:ribonuclease HI